MTVVWYGYVGISYKELAHKTTGRLGDSWVMKLFAKGGNNSIRNTLPRNNVSKLVSRNKVSELVTAQSIFIRVGRFQIRGFIAWGMNMTLLFSLIATK